MTSPKGAVGSRLGLFARSLKGGRSRQGGERQRRDDDGRCPGGRPPRVGEVVRQQEAEAQPHRQGEAGGQHHRRGEAGALRRGEGAAGEGVDRRPEDGGARAVERRCREDCERRRGSGQQQRQLAGERSGRVPQTGRPASRRGRSAGRRRAGRRAWRRRRRPGRSRARAALTPCCSGRYDWMARGRRR